MINPVKTKCLFENSGNCRNSKCTFIHPKKTCQAHSRYGSCPSESICEHRHPSKLCFHLQNTGYCNEGERCRMRHPVEYGSHAANFNQERTFLGHGRGFHHGYHHNVAGAAAGAPEDPNLSPGSPFLAPGEPWSPPFNIYKAFQNRGKGPRRGQPNQYYRKRRKRKVEGGEKENLLKKPVLNIVIIGRYFTQIYVVLIRNLFH